MANQIVAPEVSKRVNCDIIKVLMDGEWHGVGEFVTIGDVITPEIATRFYIRDVGQATAGKKPLDEQISRGRRNFVLDRLNDLRFSGLVERRGPIGFNGEFKLTEAAQLANLAVSHIAFIISFANADKLRKATHQLIDIRL